MVDLFSAAKSVCRNIADFTANANGLKLRSYQQSVASLIVDSIIHKRGLSFVIIFPRQSGKNELQAQIESYILSIYSSLPAEIVKISPTWKPQSLNAMRRLERVLKKSIIARSLWQKESGYIYRVLEARIYFMSGSPTTNIVGATATTLLECDEAQDILISKYDKDIAPMAASTNATRVFWGTAWTSRTLLARELRLARQAEKEDGIQRVFTLTANDVRKEVTAYGKFVDEQITRLGRRHPLVRTQFFSEEIDSEGGMFPPERIALMTGQHPPQVSPQEGSLYAFLIDVAGEDEALTSSLNSENLGRTEVGLANAGRDSTALTIVEIDLSTLQDEIIRAPRYLVVNRRLWSGVKHTTLYGQLRGLIDHWQPRYVIADNTGVGAGLVSFLSNAYPDKLIPFTFTSKSKSDLGWSFLAVVETGRFKEPVADPLDRLHAEFIRQCENAQTEILEGPGKIMRWSVPDGTRDERTGELVHDDLLISASLCSQLDLLPRGTAESEVIQSVDPLASMKDVY